MNLSPADPSPLPSPASPAAATTARRPVAPSRLLPLRTRERLAIATLAAAGVMALVCAWAVLELRQFFTSIPPQGYDVRDEATVARAKTVGKRVDTFASVALGARALCAVAFLVWFYRAHENLRLGGLPRLERTSGWAVGGFFVPVIGLVLPFLAMTDVWRGSHALTDGEDTEDWKRRPSSPIVLLWWLTLLGASLVATVAKLLLKSDPAFGRSRPTVAELISATDWMLAGRLVEAVAAAAAIVLVLRISVAQMRTPVSPSAVFE